MKKIIEGKKYNTETAERIGQCDNNLARNDFDFEAETLYKSKSGQHFLHHEGGANSGYNEYITLMSIENAKIWAENAIDVDDYELVFGAVVEG